MDEDQIMPPQTIEAEQTQLDSTNSDSLERDEEFYFEDGNVCLLAEQTVFKVHKSMLARHSRVFADMFEGELKSEEYSEDLYDGVQLVCVEGKAMEWVCLFELLWNPPLSDAPVSDFDIICGVLYLSIKYGMPSLKMWATKRLRKITSHPKNHFTDDPTPLLDYYEANPTHASKIIVLARKCGLATFLPVAFYHLAITSSTTLSNPTGIEYDDVVRMLVGKDRLNAQWWNLVRENASLGFQSNYPNRCRNRLDASESGELCGDAGFSGEGYSRIKRLEEGAKDPIRFLSKQSIDAFSVCEDCREEHRKALEDIYGNLRTIFDI